MTESADLLFELGTEELPPTALRNLSNALMIAFEQGLTQHHLNFSGIRPYATPRRLALLIENCVITQPNQNISRRGPALKAAFDKEGKPTKAATGFARSCGVEVEDLEHIKNDNGEWVGFHSEKQGQPARELLPGIAENALNKLPIPKRMRWGNTNYNFIRPVHWLLFLHGEQIVDCEILGVKASNKTSGHRFHHPDYIKISRPADYEQILLDKGFTIADFAKRRETIHKQIQTSADKLGGKADFDTDLLDEVTALTEWPVAITGDFEKRFLKVPQEALVLTMKKNQKYFPLFDTDGRLLNHFITIANLESPNPELIKDGNERVIRPRLSDAMFFWEQDGKRKLEDHIESLKRVVFQKKLGSMFDKTERIRDIALWIADRINADPHMTERAAMLSRCDLMTEIVCEFPDMQGLMGQYQAIRDSESNEVATALMEFYLPKFAGDTLPESKVGQAISLAERIDTISGIFSIGLKPTGDKDPYGLRRAAIGILRILKEENINLNINELISKSVTLQPLETEPESHFHEVKAFINDRLKGIYSEQGISINVVQAVMASNPVSLPEIDQKVQAVLDFQKHPQSEQLIEANKRISNILKKLDSSDRLSIKRELCSEQAELQSLDILLNNKQNILGLIQTGNYSKSLDLLASLKEPVDNFFTSVLVMDDNIQTRNNRISILAELHGLFMLIADFSQL